MACAPRGLREAWWSKFYQRNCQKHWKIVSTLSTSLKQDSRALNFTNLFVAVQRNGIRTSINVTSYARAFGSRGKVLARLFELRREMNQLVLSQNNHHLYKHLEDDRRITKIAYMTDIFEQLNELNIETQGKNENILTCSDKQIN